MSPRRLATPTRVLAVAAAALLAVAPGCSVFTSRAAAVKERVEVR